MMPGQKAAAKRPNGRQRQCELVGDQGFGVPSALMSWATAVTTFSSKLFGTPFAAQSSEGGCQIKMRGLRFAPPQPFISGSYRSSVKSQGETGAAGHSQDPRFGLTSGENRHPRIWSDITPDIIASTKAV